MDDYISREAFKGKYLCCGYLPEMPEKEFDEFPAADVAPVRHGRWEMRPTGMETDTGPEYKAYCTVCNEPNKQYQPPYCPHCGAKMDGGAENG
jgi:hypothetical protein